MKRPESMRVQKELFNQKMKQLYKCIFIELEAILRFCTLFYHKLTISYSNAFCVEYGNLHWTHNFTFLHTHFQM